MMEVGWEDKFRTKIPHLLNFIYLINNLIFKCLEIVRKYSEYSFWYFFLLQIHQSNNKLKWEIEFLNVDLWHFIVNVREDCPVQFYTNTITLQYIKTCIATRQATFNLVLQPLLHPVQEIVDICFSSRFTYVPAAVGIYQEP